MKENIFKKIIKKHSTTFYYASLFFPKNIRNDVYVLYSFLRTADDIVDEKNNKDLFIEFKKEVYLSLGEGYVSDNIIISSFSKIFSKYNFDIKYLNSFFSALEIDFIKPLKITDQKNLQEYVYGVAGVVGLMMAKIMNLPESSFTAAKEFGELMQMVNIIRDIKEDYQRGRVYILKEDLECYGIVNIGNHKNENKKNFEDLIRFEITQVLEKINKLSKDIENLPQPYRRPIKISRDVYKAIAKKIYKNPSLLWQKRVRIKKFELLIIILKNLI